MNGVAIPNTHAESTPPNPPPGRVRRWLMKVTPQRWHKYLSTEAFVMYNVGSFTTDLKWVGILAIPWEMFLPLWVRFKQFSGVAVQAVKEGWDNFLQLLF